MARRHYSDNDRAAALAVLAANDGNLSRTARETGVPLTTLKAWADAPDRAAPSEVRDELTRRLFEVMGQRELNPGYTPTNKPAGRCRRIGAGHVPAAACVYLVLCDGFAKIGMSTNLSARLVAMQSSCPHEIVVDTVARLDSRGAAADLEDELHDRYWHTHHRGEWFALSPFELNEVRSCLAGLSAAERGMG